MAHFFADAKKRKKKDEFIVITTGSFSLRPLVFTFRIATDDSNSNMCGVPVYNANARFIGDDARIQNELNFFFAISNKSNEAVYRIGTEKKSLFLILFLF